MARISSLGMMKDSEDVPTLRGWIGIVYFEAISRNIRPSRAWRWPCRHFETRLLISVFLRRRSRSAGRGSRLRHALLELLFGYVVLPGWDDVDVVVRRIANDAHRILAVHDRLDLLHIQLAKLDDAVVSERQIVLV